MSDTHTSWAPEVMVSGESTWHGNGLRFETEDEAYRNVRALRDKWFSVREIRVVMTGDPVNSQWIDDKLVRGARPGLRGGIDVPQDNLPG